MISTDYAFKIKVYSQMEEVEIKWNEMERKRWQCPNIYRPNAPATEQRKIIIKYFSTFVCEMRTKIIGAKMSNGNGINEPNTQFWTLLLELD